MPDFALSHKALSAKPQPIGELMTKGIAGDTISLAAGFVAPETLPSEELAEVLPDFMRRRGRLALQYGTTEGLLSLRKKVVERLAARDGQAARRLSLDRVILSTGSQQMLYLLSEVMLDPGDIVITAAPSYFVYLGALQLAQADIIGVPADEHGMRTDALREVLHRIAASGKAARLKIIYVTTYFDNPAGVSLSVERRREMADILASFEGTPPLLVEDAAYRELAFDGGDDPSIFSFEGGSRTAYLGTFSKPFSPGLRTGYAVLPEELAKKVTIFKCAHDFGSSNFAQHLIDYSIEAGIYDRNVTALRKNYAAKCRLMCDCLERELAGLANWTEPVGGLYVWVDLGDVETGPDGEFFAECAREGVIYVPGEFCYPDPKAAPRNKLRLCFGPISREDIEKGVARLGAVLARRGA